MSAGPPTLSKPERRHDLDWLRVLAMLAVFMFHCVHIFDPLDYHVKDAAGSQAALVIVGFMDAWLMPLFFLLSGAATWFSLQTRGAGAYVGERFTRLAVPLFTVGALLLLPPQFYWDGLTHGRGWGFAQACAAYFSTIGPNARGGFLMFWAGHLWFLYFLLVISLVCLPVVLLMKRKGGRGFLAWLSALSDRWGGAFLPAIPLVALLLLLRPVPGYHDLRSLACYILFFLLGVALPAQPGFTRSAVKNRWIALALGLAAFGSIGAMLGAGLEPWLEQPVSGSVALYHVCAGVNAWAWIVFLLGTAGRYLSRSNAFLRYANEAVLPFYILHQTALLFVATFVVTLAWTWGFKLLLLATASFTLIMLAYELVVRRFGVVRFLFGMRPRKPRPGQADAKGL